MPGPVSETVNTNAPFSAPAEAVTCPPFGVNFQALERRFSITLRSSEESAEKPVPSAPEVSTVSATPFSSKSALKLSAAEDRNSAALTGLRSGFSWPASMREMSRMFSSSLKSLSLDSFTFLT